MAAEEKPDRGPARRLQLAVRGLLLALVAALAFFPASSAGLEDDDILQPYYSKVAARQAFRERAGAAEPPKSTFAVKVARSIADDIAATRAALAGLGSSCEVLGSVAHLKGYYVVECAETLAKRATPDLLPGIASVELQVPTQRLFKRKEIPPKNPAYETLSDEWKEALRGRLDEELRSPQSDSSFNSSDPPLQRHLEKRTVYSQQQLTRHWKQLGINDPDARKQWHLYNPVFPKSDINATGAWLDGIRGKGSVVCIIDDGLDTKHPDIKANFYLAGSWDFNNPEQAPSPQHQDVGDGHGTRCAGEIAAGKNTACGIGVAYEAKVSAVRILSGVLTNADEAAATNFEYQKNDIYSCSWGPPDSGASMEKPITLSQKSYVEAVTRGRGGKGNIYVFAAGNGGDNYDQCNFDGYTNQIYTIAIGAIDWNDVHPSYSETCTALHAVTYSSSTANGPAIYTSDPMPTQCTAQHTGTSAAAPLAAGMFALVLQANPSLTWRDVQQLIYETAVVVNPDDGSWGRIARGRKYSSKYGFGKLDAFTMVRAAREFKTLPGQTSISMLDKKVDRPIPHGPEGISDSITITENMVTAAGMASIEHVQVFVTLTHPFRGELKYEVTSPSGVKSILGDLRPYDSSSKGLSNWPFTSLKYWGDKPLGTWTIKIKDTVDEKNLGQFVSWGIKIWGAKPAKEQSAARCSVNNGGCSSNAACTRSVLGVKCSCKPGFKGDGKTCVRTDTCAVGNGGCSPFAECSREPLGGLKCDCLPGSSGNGKTCSAVFGNFKACGPPSAGRTCCNPPYKTTTRQSIQKCEDACDMDGDCYFLSYHAGSRTCAFYTECTRWKPKRGSMLGHFWSAKECPKSSCG